MARRTLITAIAAALLSACATIVDQSKPGGGLAGVHVGGDRGR